MNSGRDMLGDIRNILSRFASCQAIFSGITISVIFIGIGAGIYVTMGNTLIDSYQSTTWPTVQGQVVSAELVEIRNSDNSIVYSVDVRYTYNVNGQEYENTMITLMDSLASRRNIAQDTIHKYRAGTMVTVHYKPDNPAFALLEPGFGVDTLVVSGVMVLFPLVGISILIGMLVGPVRVQTRY